MLKKLRIKFVCIMMTVVTVMLVIILGGMVHFTKTDIEQRSIQMMRAVSQGPFMPSRPGRGPDEINLPYFIVQFNNDGSIVTMGEAFDLSDSELVLDIINTANTSEEQIGEIEKYNLRYLKSDAFGHRIVFADISSETAVVNNLIKNCSLIGVAAFVVFMFLSICASIWAVKPVEEAWKQQKQFVADASHELKTPLTVILTNAELMKSDDYTQSEKSKLAESMLTVSRHMQSLVEGLLELARVDNGVVKNTVEPADFSQITEEAVLPFEPLFFENDLILNSNIEVGITINASVRHIRQVVDILLDNALKYSHKNTAVDITLKRYNGHCLLSVSGKGENISAADLKNIFKRFYRIDEARSRNGSFGLGLAIAESIVKEHKGKIWAESVNGTNTFLVQLPMWA